MQEVVAVTTGQMWTATLVAAAVVFVLGLAAGWRVRPPFPRSLPLAVLVVGVAWFASLYGWAAWTFWDDCYSAVLPPWARCAALVVGAAGGALGWAFW